MIGISTSAGPHTYWNKWFIDKFMDNKVKCLEINLSDSFFPYEEKIVKERVKPSLKNAYLSIHSTVRSLFNADEIINTSQKNLLFAEILLANWVGAKELIFHISKSEDFETIKPKINEFIPKALEFAKENNVKLLIENNSKVLFSNGDQLLWLCDNFSDLGICFDLGHALIARKRNIIASEIELAKTLSKNISYAHIHDSPSNNDDHSYLGSGLENPIETIKILKQNTKINKWIIETHKFGDAIKTLEILKQLNC